jgi:hypothetical protein
MAQKPAVSGNWQVPVASSQLFVVQLSASVHAVPASQVAAALQVPQLAVAPSSQRWPVRVVHAVVLVVGVHAWQGFDGLSAPLA